MFEFTDPLFYLGGPSISKTEIYMVKMKLLSLTGKCSRDNAILERALAVPCRRFKASPDISGEISLSNSSHFTVMAYIALRRVCLYSVKQRFMIS